MSVSNHLKASVLELFPPQNNMSRKNASKKRDLKTGLTEGEFFYCIYRFFGFGQREAAVHAGYSESKGLDSFASKLERRQQVTRFIQVLRDREREGKIAYAIASKHELLMYLTRVLRMSVKEMDDTANGDLLQMSKTTCSDGDWRSETEMLCKMSAAKELAKLQGFYPDHRHCDNANVMEDTKKSWTSVMRRNPVLRKELRKMLDDAEANSDEG